jgi:hypothetical protein
MEILRFRRLVDPAALQMSDDWQPGASATLKSLLASLSHPSITDATVAVGNNSSDQVDSLVVDSGVPEAYSSSKFDPVRPSSSNHVTAEASMLTSILRPVDAKLRACSQFQEASETVRFGLQRSSRRVQAYGESLESLKGRLSGFQEQFDTHEVTRNEHAAVAGKEISDLQEEERRLVELLSKVRQSLSTVKRQHSSVLEEDNQQRFREKIKIYRTSKDLELCTDLLSRSERSKEVYSQFNEFLGLILKHDSLFATEASVASTSASAVSAGTGNSSVLKVGKQGKMPSASTPHSNSNANTRSVQRQKDWKSTVGRVSQWLSTSTGLSQSHNDNASEYNIGALSPEIRSRVIYEGLRIAHSLLAQCYKDLDSARPHLSRPLMDVSSSSHVEGSRDAMITEGATQHVVGMPLPIQSVMLPVTINAEWARRGSPLFLIFRSP